MCTKLYIFVAGSSTFIPPKLCRTQRKEVPSFSLKYITSLYKSLHQDHWSPGWGPRGPSGPSPSTWRVAFFRMFEEFGFEAAWNSGDTVLSPGASCNLFSLLLRLPQLMRIGVDCHFRISLVAHNCVLNCGNWKSIGEQDGEIMVCTP